MLQGMELSGAEGGFSLTVPPLVLAHLPWHKMRMKQCPRSPGRLQPSGRKETGGALTWKVKWRSWRSKVFFSGTEGGSVDPEGKVGQSARRQIHKRRK